MKKLIKLVDLKAYLALYDREKISLSRFTELLNECANENLELNKIMESEKANGTKEEKYLNILHQNKGYYVSNEGSVTNPSYHVWRPGITQAKADSAYQELSLAISRCNYLAKTHNQ